MSEFIGARISLVSRSDIRYVGTLHEINSDESTVSLENVKSFGTEGRKGKAEEEVGPSDQLYEYIVFRSTDVKDLRIEETPSVKENKPPPVPVDPAIVGARPRPTKAPGPPGPPGQHGPPGIPSGVPPAGPGFGYYPPHMAGWGRGSGLGGPNGFGGMPYPPPPGWFPPGQEFPPPGPGPWNNYAFPPGPGGPLDMYGQPNRQPPHNQAVNNQAPSKQNQPLAPGPRSMPIGSATEKMPAGPAQQATAQQEKVKDAKHATQPPLQPSASNAPPPPVESKPSVEEVKATAASLASAATAAPQASRAQDASKPIPSGPKNASLGPIMPAVPLPAALTTKTAQPTAGTSKPASQEVNAAALRDATQAAKAAVAMAMAKLEKPELSQQTTANAMDNLTKKVNEMRVQSARGSGGNRGNRGRGARQAKVDVPDADFDFASANAKFNKRDVVKEAIAGSPLTETAPTHGSVPAPEASADTTNPSDPAPYNKSRSFFDNISSEAKDRADNHGQKPGGREWRGEEQRKNMETFGQSSVDGGYGGYRGRGRGRGGRGGRGGYSRGRGGGGGGGGGGSGSYGHEGPVVTQ